MLVSIVAPLLEPLKRLRVAILAQVIMIGGYTSGKFGFNTNLG